MDVPGERDGVAMIEMAAKRQRVKLIDGRTARLDHPRAHTRNAIHGSRMDAMEVDRVGMGAGVDKLDADPVALYPPQGRPGDRPL